MQARLVNKSGIYFIELGAGEPPGSLKHSGVTYRLCSFDDPEWPESFALYAAPGVECTDAVAVALGNEP